MSGSGRPPAAAWVPHPAWGEAQPTPIPRLASWAGGASLLNYVPSAEGQEARPPASSPGLSALPRPTSAMMGPPRGPLLLEGAEGEANGFPNPFLLRSSSFSQMSPGWWVRLVFSLSPESTGWEKGSL